MFKSSTSDGIASLERKVALRAAAELEWPFLAAVDIAAVENEGELVALVQSHSGRTAVEAAPIVRNWLEQQGIRPFVGLTFQQRTALGIREDSNGNVDGIFRAVARRRH